MLLLKEDKKNKIDVLPITSNVTKVYSLEVFLNAKKKRVWQKLQKPSAIK